MKKASLLILLMMSLVLSAKENQPAEGSFPDNPVQQEAQQNIPHTGSIETLPLDELAALADAYAEIKKSYVKDLSDKEILDGAIRGMLSNLDPYSTYLTAEQLAELEESATGDYAGIGIGANHLPDGIEVTQVFEDSPAAKAGLKVGNLITAINDEKTANMSNDRGSELMRGQPGSKVTVTFVDSSGNQKSVTITRQVIHVTSVRFELLEPNIGFTRIDEFQTRSAEDLSKAISKLELQNKAPLQGLILDLRNNPGGILDGAIEVADLFLNSGVIVSTKSRLQQDNEVHYATSGDILRNKPLVVLINNSSASASEIVAGALQDHKRAIIMGTQSFGKAMVQTILPIHGGNAVKLTTSHYYTPNQRLIQNKGIAPDRVIEHKITAPSGESAQNWQDDQQVVAAVSQLKGQPIDKDALMEHSK
ncbi:MAG: S41 family peptidase [Kangiellaceae bacterium]|nr:S41 family peptidase [Kangiellaceae bacterium]